jgi:sec-independent protein translocase protein TatA
MFPLLDMPGGWEWLIILAIVILVFGAAKLPELARGTGQALRIFKAETKGLRDDDKGDKAEPTLKAEQISPSVEARQAELDRRQAELDAERARLQQPDA